MYDIQGADARTGQDRSISFEADDDDAQAAAVAKVRGVMVAKLERRPATPTVKYERRHTVGVFQVDGVAQPKCGSSDLINDVLNAVRAIVGGILAIGTIALVLQSLFGSDVGKGDAASEI